MFTGLIQETGTVTAVQKLAKSSSGVATRITVSAGQVPSQLAMGDSVAVSGVCLTAVEILDGRFSADLAQETLERTSLGHLRIDSLVNLELPARAGDRLGGHVVQGHIDGTGELVRLTKIEGGEDWRLRVRMPLAFAKYVVPQGSITIEGISLTVAEISGDQLEVAIIPHTYQATNLRTLRPGDPVNIEVDVLAKYAEKIAKANTGPGLRVDELIRQGF